MVCVCVYVCCILEEGLYIFLPRLLSSLLEDIFQIERQLLSPFSSSVAQPQTFTLLSRLQEITVVSSGICIEPHE